MAEHKYLDEAGLSTVWSKIKETFVVKNTAITGATKCKITYDSKGLVTAGADLAASDIPTLTLAKISDSGTAAAKNVCTTAIAAASTDTNLPTAAQVAAFVEGKGYKTTDNNTTYTFAGGTNKFTVTPSNGTAQEISITPSISNNALTTTTISGSVTGAVSGTAGVGGSVGAPAVTINKGTVTDALGYTPVNESKAAAASGTALSLVTTGEKATWNGKQNAITESNKLSSSLVSGLGAAATKGVDTSLTLTSTSTNLPTSAAVASLISSSISAAEAMRFKGTVNTTSGLPTTNVSVGDTYVVAAAGTYAGETCEQGDMIIAVVGTKDGEAQWTVVQANINGAVTGPTSSTANHIAVFNGTTGKVIKDSGYTIATSVPANAVFTDSSTTLEGHYSPTGGTAQSVPSSAAALTAGTSTVITSVTIDTKGHVTSVSGGKLPEYSLPTASSTVKGGVKVGSGLTITNEVLSVTDTCVALTTDEINAILV